jgi:hypothetical protein
MFRRINGGMRSDRPSLAPAGLSLSAHWARALLRSAAPSVGSGGRLARPLSAFSAPIAIRCVHTGPTPVSAAPAVATAAAASAAAAPIAPAVAAPLPPVLPLAGAGGVPGFYQRPLPSHLIPFASAQGKRLFAEALASGHMEGFFLLAQQFQTQSEPACKAARTLHFHRSVWTTTDHSLDLLRFCCADCGPTTLSMILNSLGLDPNRIWKGSWRWFSEEMLIDRTRSSRNRWQNIEKEGLSFEEFLFLAECNGSRIQGIYASDSTEEAFRSAVLAATSRTDLHLAVAFARSVLGQTGSGHYSPIGGYHSERDLVLVLDVARFKYPPYWVPVSTMWKAMLEHDPSTSKAADGALSLSLPLPPPSACMPQPSPMRALSHVLVRCGLSFCAAFVAALHCRASARLLSDVPWQFPVSAVVFVLLSAVVVGPHRHR